MSFIKLLQIYLAIAKIGQMTEEKIVGVCVTHKLDNELYCEKAHRLITKNGIDYFSTETYDAR